MAAQRALSPPLVVSNYRKCMKDKSGIWEKWQFRVSSGKCMEKVPELPISVKTESRQRQFPVSTLLGVEGFPTAIGFVRLNQSAVPLTFLWVAIGKRVEKGG